MADGFNCYALVVEKARASAVAVGQAYFPYSQAEASAYCHDVAGTTFITNGIVVASTAYLIPDGQSYSDLPTTQSYSFSQIASDLGCYASYRSSSSENSEFDMVSAVASFAPFLPESPSQFRLPTIISNMSGQGTLAANLAIELFSAIWQYVALLLCFKLFKLIRG